MDLESNNSNRQVVTRPSKYSFFWWRFYLSREPTSINSLSDEDRRKCHYNRNGEIHHSQDYHVPVFYFDPPSFWMFYWWGMSNNSNNNNSSSADCGQCNQIVAILIVVLLFIILMVIVFYYPPVVTICWIILVISSFVGLGGTVPECQPVRTYNAASAVICILFIIHAAYGVILLQKYCNYYFPGTPGVRVNVDKLISRFKFEFIFYAVGAFLSVPMIIWGAIWSRDTDNNPSDRFSQCPGASVTLYAWLSIHVLNMVAFISMYRRMRSKYEKLVEPPQYTEVDTNYNSTKKIASPKLNSNLPAYSAVASTSNAVSPLESPISQNSTK